jgi:hypothetical protein
MENCNNQPCKYDVIDILCLRNDMPYCWQWQGIVKDLRKWGRWRKPYSNKRYIRVVRRRQDLSRRNRSSKFFLMLFIIFLVCVSAVVIVYLKHDNTGVEGIGIVNIGRQRSKPNQHFSWRFLSHTMCRCLCSCYLGYGFNPDSKTWYRMLLSWLEHV